MGKWATRDDTYDISQIYTDSTDGKGHKSHLRANVPPSMMARMEALASDPALPAYRTKQDVVRDAIHHRLRWIEKNKKDVESNNAHTAMLRTHERINRIKKEGQDQKKFVNDLEEALALHANEKNRKLLWGTIAEAKRALDAISPPYLSQVRELLTKYEAKARKLGENK